MHISEELQNYHPASIYLFKVNNENSRAMCEIWPKLTIKILEWRRSGAFIVNLEQMISHISLVFPRLTLDKWLKMDSIIADVFLWIFRNICKAGIL